MLQEFLDYMNLHRTEGKQGVENLATIASCLGYKDPTHFGQFSPNASYGDLIEFFQDNPGAVEAVVEWIENQVNVNTDWQESLESYLPELEEDDEDEE